MSQKEEDTHQEPVWLTKDYLENVLRKYKKDETLKIVRLCIKPATAKGENYISLVTRVHATIRFMKDGKICENVEPLMVKSTCEGDPYLFHIMNQYKVCETEMEMYESVLPELTKLLQEIGDHDKLFAETIHVDYVHSAIIFEDLTASNFLSADRLVGMDVSHAQLALKKLAKMHATAAVLNERKCGILQHFDRGIHNRHTKAFSPYFLNMLDVCANFARKCEDLGEYYAKKLDALQGHLVEYAIRVHDPFDHQFNTLTHGDYWTNNIMLRYCLDEEQNKKSVGDLLMIDFQFCNWASPALDLHYFFNTSLEWELRQHHQEEMVQYYYQHLTDTLTALKYKGKIPTLHEFWLQLEAARFYAVTSSVCVQPVMINNKNTTDADFNALLLDDERGREFRKTLYLNPMVQKYVKTLLPLFDRRGLLNAAQ